MTTHRLLTIAFCLLALPPLPPLTSSASAGERLYRVEVDNVAAYYDSDSHTYIEEATGEKCALSIDDAGRVNITRTERAIELAPYGVILYKHIKGGPTETPPNAPGTLFGYHPHLIQAPALIKDEVPEPPAVEQEPAKSVADLRAKIKRTGIILPIAEGIPAVALPVDGNTASSPTYAERMLTASNNLRTSAGLRPQVLNEQLNAAAQDHANYMARTGQFSHYVNGSPSSRASKYGFTSGVRENIAYSGYGGDQVANAFRMWQNSSGHYASIVSNTSSAGFGLARSANGMTYTVGVYGTPQGEATPSNPSVVTNRPRTDIAPTYNYRRGLFGRR